MSQNLPLNNQLPKYKYAQRIKEVCDAYKQLLIIQYRNKPKARATIEALVKLLLLEGLVFSFEAILDVDTASGQVLDYIGKIVNCPRKIVGLMLNKKWFSFEKEDAAGFSLLGNLSDGIFKNIYDYTHSFYSLRDEEYRRLIKFKILKNHLKATWAQIDEAVWVVWQGQVILKNNYDLTIAWWVAKELETAAKAAIKLGYLTAPLGIGFYYIILVENPLNIFGFKRVTEPDGRVGGFSTIGDVRPNTFLTLKNVIRLKDMF